MLKTIAITSIAAVGPGGSARLTAKLEKGVRYGYWCGIGAHAEKGMRGSLVAR